MTEQEAVIVTSVPRRRLRVGRHRRCRHRSPAPLPGAAVRSGRGTGAPASETGLWIVQLTTPSVAAAQAPTGTVDVTTPSAQAQLDLLAAEQAAVADQLSEELGRPVDVEASYRNVLNAIVIEADPAEVPVIAGVPGVAAVEPDEVYELTTDASHDLIGSAAIWDGDTGPELPTRGEGVVVGILDSGINAFHPSFAATDGEGYTHTNPYGAHLGVCDPTHPNHDPICNDKLVGAWSSCPGTPPATPTVTAATPPRPPPGTATT